MTPETIRAMDPQGINTMADEIKLLRAALQHLVDDVLSYERLNNLSANPGRKYCWDSVARAVEILEHTIKLRQDKNKYSSMVSVENSG